MRTRMMDEDGVSWGFELIEHGVELIEEENDLEAAVHDIKKGLRILKESIYAGTLGRNDR
jgi:hypothetical protein